MNGSFKNGKQRGKFEQINDELERLSNEELEQVAGGTRAEYEELRDIFGDHIRKARSNKIDPYKFYESPEWIQDWLKFNLNIDAQINQTNADPNVYKRYGETLTHEQVVAKIQEYYKNH